MALTQTLANMVLGGRGNQRQMVFGIPAGPVGEDPGVLCLESSSAVAGTHSKVYLWADSANNLRFGSTISTNEDSDGSPIGTSSGATPALTNLSGVSINTSLISDTTATDDLGSSAIYWRYGYLGTLYLTSTWLITATLAVATVTGSITLTDGDIVITEGKMTVSSVTDEQIVLTRTQATTTGPWVVIQSADTSDDYPGLHVDFNGTGAINAMNITTDAAGGFGLSITAANAAGQGLTSIAAANSTVSAIVADGTTNTWLGANGVGLVHIKADGTLAHAGASLLNITHTGQTAASALGSSLRIVDSATNGTGACYAVHMTSSTNHVLYLLTTTATGATPLTIKGTANATVALASIDATEWLGASTIGCLTVAGTGVLAAGANLLRVTSSAANEAASYLVEINANTGAFAGSTNGTCLRIIDAGAVAGTSYALYANSTANGAACFATGATGMVCLTLAPVTASTAAVVNVAAGAWVGATGVGAVTISGSGTLAHANASLLLIANSAATGTAANLGSSLRIVDTSGAQTSYVAHISSTNNSLLCLAGTATGKSPLTITAGANTVAALSIATTSVNATGVGTVHVSGTGNLAHANATELYVTHLTGTIAANSLGAIARFVDASAASATSYAVQMTSTANGILNLTGVATAYSKLNITDGAATVPAIKITTTSVNAADIGTIHIINTATPAHVDATQLYVAQTTGTAPNAQKGICARFIDTTASATTAAAVQISSTNNRALACTVGQADFPYGISTMRSTAACAGVAPTLAECITAFGAANTHTAGWVGILDTSDTKCFLVYCDGAVYFYGAALTVLA